MSDTPTFKLVDNIVTALAHAVIKGTLEFCIGLRGAAGATCQGTTDCTQRSTPAQAAAAAAQDSADGSATRRTKKTALYGALGCLFASRT